MKWQDISVDIKTLSPGGCLYKIRLQRDVFETCNKWPKWHDVSVDIKILSTGVVCPWPVAIYIYKIMERCV